MDNIGNAIIKSIEITLQRDTFLVCCINLEIGNGWSQQYQSVVLAKYGDSGDVTGRFLLQLMKIVGENLNKVKGKPVRIKRDYRDVIQDVGHYIDNIWLSQRGEIIDEPTR